MNHAAKICETPFHPHWYNGQLVMYLGRTVATNLHTIGTNCGNTNTNDTSHDGMSKLN